MRLAVLTFCMSMLLFLIAAPIIRAQYAPALVISKPVLLNKDVLDPRTSRFVENLLGDQYRFLLGQEVKFRVEVRNTGSGDLSSIVLKDILPAGMSLVAGEGAYDPGKNVLTVSIDKLKPGESRFWLVSATHSGDKGGQVANLTCFNNKAEAWMGSEMVSDTASVCFQSKVLGEVMELPVTGIGSTLVIAGSGLAGGLGLLVLGNRLYRKIFSRTES